MYSVEDIYIQAVNDPHSYKTSNGSIINYGVKIQKFPSKTELLNCSRNGNYYQEFSDDEYMFFFIHGWKKGGIRLSMMNCKMKLDLIDNRIRNEVNTRKNDKHIKKLKSSRDKLLIKYSKRKQQLNKIESNERNKQHL
tara:strand:- start:167 stop:580 length:414 start_codon:yes stop_codon:yes gene_type:complete